MLRNHNNGFYFIFNEHETDISIFKCTRQTRLEIPNQFFFLIRLSFHMIA